MMVVEKLDYPKANIYLHVTSRVERELRARSCGKEPETVAFIESLPKGSVFYDIGANTGSYSFVAAANGLRTYAFEPAGETYTRLEQNCDLNSELSVFAYPVLLGDANGPVDFTFSSLEPGAALHSLGAGGEHVTRMEMRTLDVFVATLNLPYPDHMKIDVDGSELRVLIGAEVCLGHVRSLLVEIDPVLPMSQQVQPFLEGRGFRVASEHPHERSGVVNVVLTR